MRRAAERIARMRESVAWLRWLLPILCLWAAAGAPPRPSGIVASSGTHGWWSVRDAEQWTVVHATGGANGSPVSHVAARFDDEPAALAADRDQVWVLFRAAGGRHEVVTGRALRNPASDLWFISPAGMRLCASLPAAELESVAGFDGELWCLLPARQDSALRLVGEDWKPVALPACDGAPTRRALIVARGTLWFVALMTDGSSRRWSREEGAWRQVPVELPAWRRPVDGAVMLSFESAPGALGSIEAGRFVEVAMVPSGRVAIGWGGGFAALDWSGPEITWCAIDAATGQFGEARPVVPQASTASRWFHLPLLGVASLGVLLLAAIMRAVRGSRTGAATSWRPMPLVRRLAALAIDAAPVGAAALLALDADLDALVCAPIWATDLQDAMPFVWMTLGTVVFGTLEECAGARSMGKRVLGGRVVRQDGAPASVAGHGIRNLLKGLTMLCPILAVPAITSRRGIGVAEAVSDTAVIEA